MVANALPVGERRKRATEAKTAAFLALLQALPVAPDDETATRSRQESLHWARAHQPSGYDAAYPELALRRGLPLATLDDRLKAAAAAVGVAAFRP